MALQGHAEAQASTVCYDSGWRKMENIDQSRQTA
jgi:hypothetical protein